MTDKNPFDLKYWAIGFINLVNTYGAVHKPNGMQLNSYNLPLKTNLRYFLHDLSTGIRKYESLRSIVAMNEFFRIRHIAVFLSSILKLGAEMNVLSFFKLRMNRISPLGFVIKK